MRVWQANAFPFDYVSTDEIWLQDGAAATGGAARGMRAGTPGVIYRNVAALNLDLPGGPGAAYDVYTVSSPDGETVEIHGANFTGHSLLNASSDQVVFNGQSPELHSSTTYQTVYADGSNYVGQWTADSIIGALSSQTIVSGYNYIAVPPLLPGDRQTVALHYSEIADGNGALWINLPAETGTIGFLIVPSTPPLATASVQGVAWSDVDNDGIRETGEQMMSGVVAHLLDGLGNIVAATTTDSNGNYYFANLTAGTYRVVFYAPDTYLFAPQDQGTDDTIDSDVDADGRSAYFSLFDGVLLDDLDAGLTSQSLGGGGIPIDP